MLPTATLAAEPEGIPTSATAELLAAFFAGRSPHTLAAYRGDLEAFSNFIGTETIEAATARLFNGTRGEANFLALSWRSHLVEAGRSPATINRRLSALRALVSLGRPVGVIDWSLDVKSARAEAYRDTAGPKREGVAALLVVALAQRDKRKAARDASIIRLLHDLALRRGEVCHLDLADIDVAASRVMVLGKGRREKIGLTLPDATRMALAAWIAVRGSVAGPLFFSVDRSASKSAANRLSGAGVWHIVMSIGHKAGMKTWPHALRHTGITTALDMSKGDLRAVQRYSRHADVRVLQTYDDNRTDLGGKIAALVAAD